MIKQFIFRWLVNFFGLWTAATILNGAIAYQEHLRVLVVASLLLSIVNALVRPLVILMTLPAVVLSLGLFTFVINAFMLYLVTIFYSQFQVTSFWAALFAVFIIWLLNYLLNDLLERTDEKSV